MFRCLVTIFVFSVLIFNGTELFAVGTPKEGDLMYKFYDVLINDIVKGPIGVAGGVVGIIFTGFMAVKGQMLPALLGVAATATAFGAETIVTSFGLEVVGRIVEVIG